MINQAGLVGSLVRIETGSFPLDGGLPTRCGVAVGCLGVTDSGDFCASAVIPFIRAICARFTQCVAGQRCAKTFDLRVYFMYCLSVSCRTSLLWVLHYCT